MEDAERKAHRLIRQWLVWLRCRNAERTPCLRIDLLVSRIAPGKSEVKMFRSDICNPKITHLVAGTNA